MNKRIKELNRQALFEVLNGQDPDKDIDKMYIPAQFTKKFAELLIQECAGIIVEQMKRTPQVHSYWGPFWDGLDSAQKMINKHFGVEK